MTRITKALIQGMQENAVEKAGINKARIDLKARDQSLTEQLRVLSLGGQDEYQKVADVEKKLRKLVESVPKHMRASSYLHSQILPRDTGFNVNLAGAKVYRNFIDADGNQKSKIYGKDLIIQQGDPAVAEFYAIEDEKKALDEREKLIRTQVGAAASKVTTVKRLLEIWPESAELLPAAAESSVVNFPAIRTEDLNKLIGLPSEAAE